MITDEKLEELVRLSVAWSMDDVLDEIDIGDNHSLQFKYSGDSSNLNIDTLTLDIELIGFIEEYSKVIKTWSYKIDVTPMLQESE